MRAASEKLLSLNQPLAPHPGPRLEAPPEEGQGLYSRREAGRREQGPSPQVGRLEPAQARLLPAGRPRASRLCRPPRALCRPRSRGSAPSSHAGRGPALAVPLLGAPAAGRPRASAAAYPAPAPGPASLPAACACAPTPLPLGLALLSRRNRGPALRRSSPPPPTNNPRRAPRGPRHRPRYAQDLGCPRRCLPEKLRWASRSAALGSPWAGRQRYNSQTSTAATGT